MNPLSLAECKSPQGRRLGAERRTYSYTHHLPERRCGSDRRRAGRAYKAIRSNPGKLRWKAAAA